MPAFRQIQNTLMPSGQGVRAVDPGRPLDLSPVAEGLDSVNRMFVGREREAERMRKELQAQQERQEADEARIAVSNLTTERQAALTERLSAARNSPDGLAGATAAALKEHEEWVKATDKTLSPIGKQLFAIQANNLRLKTHEAFFGAETVSRQSKLVADFGIGLDAGSRTVWSDPSQYTDVLARALATARTIDVPEDVRQRMIEKARDGITQNAALALVRDNPQDVLRRLGYAQQPATPATANAPAKPAAWVAPEREPGMQIMGVNIPALTNLVMQAESGGRRYEADGKTLLASAKQARGEMQVLDSTNTNPGFGITPARDNSPDERARVGQDYLATMVSRYQGDIPKALAAYNAGPGRLDEELQKGGDWLARMPAETRAYVAKIGKQYDQRRGTKAEAATGGAQTFPVASSGYGPTPARVSAADDPVFGNLSPEKLETIANHALTAVRQQDAAAKAALAAQQTQGRELARGIIGALQNGYAQDPTIVNEAKRLTQGTSTYADIVAAETQYRVTGEFRQLPPAVQAQALADSKPRAVTPEGAALHETLTKVAADAQAKLKADGFTYGAQTLGLTPAPIDTSSIVNLVPGLATRARQAAQIQAWAGQPILPLSPQESESIGRTLSALAPTAKAEATAKLYASVGPQAAPMLVQQIDKSDKALALGMAAGLDMTTAGRRTSELIFKGQQALKDGTIKPDRSVNGTKPEIARFIGDALGGAVRDDIIESARLIAVGAESEGQSIDAARAVRLAIGGDVIEHNGRRIPVPAGVTQDNMRDVLARAAPSLQSQMPGGVAIVGGMQVPAAQLLTALPDATLEPAGMGRYFIRAGGSLVRNAQGQELILKVPGVAP